MASALSASLAKSIDIRHSFEIAHKYVNNAIKTNPKFGRGNGPINHCFNINGFISGKEPGVEDYIFFGNFKWVYSCSACNLLDEYDPIYNWYRRILEITNL